MTRYLIIFFLIFYPINGFGQETNLLDIIINIAEELAADDDDPEAVTIFLERLHELADDPVMINSTDENEISRLFFLTDFQVKAIADHVLSSGQIVSDFEIASIPGFDKETAEMMIPFISLKNKIVYASDSSRMRNSMISNFSIKSGKSDSSSLGSRWRILSKYKFSTGRFTGGFTLEKDPGEKLLAGHPPVPDFLSANIAFTGTGLIRRIIVGDFSARFGQGTNINTGFRRGISLTSPGYMSARDEIKPYTSTEENKFFRGVAADFSMKNIGLTVFYSKNYSDATISPSSDSLKYIIENFYLAGIHNTASLLQKKDAISTLTYGMIVTLNLNNVKVGLVWSQNKFSLPVSPAGDDPERIFDFKGDKSNLFTVYYNTFIKKILLYGELTASDNYKYAVVNGISFRPSDRLTINFLYRNYNPGYPAFYGNGPGSGSNTANETGILGNFTFEAARHLFISGGYDIQNFPWLKYRCSAPSHGTRQEIKIRFLPSEKLSFDASYSYRFTTVDNDETQRIPVQDKLITRSLKISVRYSMLDNLMSGTRIDYKFVNPSGSTGFLIFQEINFSFRQISFWARYCIFNTDDWLSRIYTYENDLLYSFSIPALAGEGSRSYIMVKWKIHDFAEFRFKYGNTTLVTNGYVLGNTDEFKVQFRTTF